MHNNNSTPNEYTERNETAEVSSVEMDLLLFLREGRVPVPPRPESMADDPALAGFCDPADVTPEAGERERALWRAALRGLAVRAREFAELAETL